MENETLPTLHSMFMWAYKRASQSQNVKNSAFEFYLQMIANNEYQMKFWETCKNIMFKDLTSFHKRLNVSIDEYSGDSFYTRKNVDYIIDLMENKKMISVLDNGDLCCNLDLDNYDINSLVIIRGNGSLTPLARILASMIDAYFKHGFDYHIYVVPKDQMNRYEICLEILENLGYKWNKQIRLISFGLINAFYLKNKNTYHCHVDDVSNFLMKKVTDPVSKYFLSVFQELEFFSLSKK